MKIPPTIIIILFLLEWGYAQTISGTVRDRNKIPLPFVSVYLNNTSYSCSSNEKGDYVLKVPKPGNYEVVFRYIGYKQLMVKLNVTKNISYNATLQQSEVMLKETIISAREEDPAYRIIREAIKKKDYYLNNPSSFKCNVYNKNMVRMKLPETIMGFKRSKLITNEKDLLDTAGRGVIYFSESLTELYVQKPDKQKEVMISSKVSGDQSAYSFNTASMMLYNLYENSINAFSQRGIISPLSNSAFMYYKYHLEGTFTENGDTINKIELIPKRQNDPVFRGHIYIVEKKWNIYSTDLLLIKDAQIEFFDSLMIKQQYAPVDSVNWMPISNVFDYRIKLFGIDIYGYFIGIQSDYNINPSLPSNFFNNEVSAIKDSANQKDSTYWNKVRPLALTTEEHSDYNKKDSLEVKYDSPAYQDSLDRKGNRFRFGNVLWSRYNHYHSSKEWNFSISPLLFNIDYNTVEGVSLNSVFSFRKTLHDKPFYSLTAKVRYGFSDGHLNGMLSYRRSINPLHFSEFSFSAGKFIFQFNPAGPIDKWVNMYYTLFEKLNYAKYYENLFARMAYKKELTNGLYFDGIIGMEYRNALQNSANFCFNTSTVRQFTSNNPELPDDYQTHFPSHFMAGLDVGFVFVIKQKYQTEPGSKMVLGSQYPQFSLRYKKGFGEVDFDFLKLGMNQRVDMKILGFFKYKIEYGTFFNNRLMYFVDYHHSNGNQTIFLKHDRDNASDDQTIRLGSGGAAQDITGFNLLPYYQYSTNRYFVEAHAEQHFCGWLLNKIPLIRKLRFNEVVGIHYLKNNLISNYFEGDFGIEHIGIPKLKVPLYFRIDWVMSFTPKARMENGFRVGMAF